MSDPSEPLDDCDAPLEYSPLERDVTRDGTTVRVCIYRGPGDPGWVLEVEDEQGGSTVWDDLFETDEQALAEALRTIDEDGIHSFADRPPDQRPERALWEQTIAQPAIAALRGILDASADTMSFHGACGVFAGVATTPELVRPSEWIEIIKRDHAFADLADAQCFTSGALALYTEVLRSVGEQRAHCCPAPDDTDAVREFCAGYVRIALNDPSWAEDGRALAMLVPMCALAGVVPLEKVSEVAPTFAENPEAWLRRAREELAATVASLHAYWAEGRKAAVERLQPRALPQRRAAPKVGRNDPCPCGSGKKFKRCCAN